MVYSFGIRAAVLGTVVLFVGVFDNEEGAMGVTFVLLVVAAVLYFKLQRRFDCSFLFFSVAAGVIGLTILINILFPLFPFNVKDDIQQTYVAMSALEVFFYLPIFAIDLIRLVIVKIYRYRNRIPFETKEGSTIELEVDDTKQD